MNVMTLSIPPVPSILCFLGFHRWGKSWRSYLYTKLNRFGGPGLIEQSYVCNRWPCQARKIEIEVNPHG